MNSQRDLKLLSIVVPCHNESANVEILVSKLKEALGRYPFEIIFVDDSSDDTPDRIKRMGQLDPRIKMRRLTRSFGQNQAIFAGLLLASGDATVIMDADLEDPPSSILKLIEKWCEGYDIVAYRRIRQGTSWVYRLASKLYYSALSRISYVAIPAYVGEYRILDRRVVRFLNRLPENMKFFRGLSVWAGHRILVLDLERDTRLAGTTNYNLFKSFAVAVDSMLAFSFFPLRLISLTGFFLSFCSGTLAVVYLIWRLVQPNVFGQGWASLFLAVMFFSSINLLFLGVVAEYVGRIFQQVQGRPQHVVDYDFGFEQEATSITSEKARTGT